MKERRVVVTGIGIICSLGNSPKDIISSIKRDRVFFQPSWVSSEIICCPILGFEFKRYISSYKYSRYLPRSWKFILCAAKRAIEDSKIDKYHLKNTGLFLGVGPNVEIPYSGFSKKALGILEILPNTPLFCISHLLDIHGENLTISNACSSSLQAIGEGFLRIKAGLLKVALCGGGDSRLEKGGVELYHRAGVLLTKGEDINASDIYAPFDKENYGFVPGEGGAFLVLEELEHAKKRNANILGEIVGYSCSLDGVNPTAPDKGAVYSSICVKRALEMSGLNKIDVVFSHGTGTKLNDEMEINLIKGLFSGNRPYICALKSWIGHLAAGCGAVEMVIGILCLNNKLLPRIRNLKSPRDNKLNFLFSNLNVEFKNAVFQSFGFGGQNAAVVIKR